MLDHRTEFGGSARVQHALAVPELRKVPSVRGALRIRRRRCTGSATGPSRTLLWHLPNYEFAGIYSATELLARAMPSTTGRGTSRPRRQRVWRRLASVAPHRGPVQRAQDRAFGTSRRYKSWRTINRSWKSSHPYDYLPIIARTEVWSDDGKTRATIEYPIKTMKEFALWMH